MSVNSNTTTINHHSKPNTQDKWYISAQIQP